VSRPGTPWLFALAYLVILEVMLVAAVLYWPDLAANLPAARRLAAPIPVLGQFVERVSETGVRGYLIGQHFFKGCNTLGTAAAVLFAAPAIAGEAHRGTLELLLARPHSRARLLLERWAGGAVAVTVPVFLSTLTIPLLCTRVNEVQPYGPLLWCALHQSLFLLAIHALAFLCSALGSHPTKIALAILFFTTFEFSIYMIKVVTHWSVFRLCDLDTLLAVADGGRLDARLVLPLLAWIALCVGAALFAFRRRSP